jgi:EAL domain-containing protein (putative c-di-GMP-specific phosphodiesterase class I)
LRDKAFLLHYQARIDSDGNLSGAEALVRWQHPLRGMLSPPEFIALAEETGLSMPLGQWVLETACAQLAAWAASPETARLCVDVNISARQFRHPGFVAQVLAALARSGASPHKLTLEFTEAMLVDHVEDTIAKMTALKAKGVRFSLDDFGTSYSSLSGLKRLPLDQLKIDRSLVSQMLTFPNDAVVVRAIIAVGKSLGMAVIAEGVETDEQRDFLARHHCHAYQGYLFGPPRAAEQFEASLRQTRNAISTRRTGY